MNITVTFETEVPDNTPLDDIQKWLEFNLGAIGSLRGDNALVGEDIQAKYSSVYFREA